MTKQCIYGFLTSRISAEILHRLHVIHCYMDLEHTRFCKFLQVQQNKFVLAEVALRFWNKFDNFWMWSILLLYTGQSNFWALEQA